MVNVYPLLSSTVQFPFIKDNYGPLIAPSTIVTKGKVIVLCGMKQLQKKVQMISVPVCMNSLFII
jgi:hypothetical protein